MKDYEKSSNNDLEETEKISANMQKYYNYREQMVRLKKAMNQHFYLEAIFIEYAILEDRLESILRHSNLWKEPEPGKQMPGMNQKLKKVTKLAEHKSSVAHKYFSVEILSQIDEWRKGRNPLTHALLKQQLHTEDLETFAMKGNDLVKRLCSKSTSYKRAMERSRI